MKTPLFLAVALAMSVSAVAQTSAPAAPSLTAGAEFKGLRLDWDPVPGATWYQLEYRAHQNGSFVQQGDDFPATATSTQFSFPLHLYDWTYARYRLAACNSAGCTRSAEVSVSDLRRYAVGYFKASQPRSGGNFGSAADLSSDGYHLVTTAPGEEDGSTAHTLAGGAVYVFARHSNGEWYQRARLPTHVVASVDEGQIALGVATSASGNTVAVGMPTTQVAGATNQEGEVDVYFFKNDVWGRKRITRLPVTNFGESVALDDTGYLLAIGLNDSQRSVAIYKSINGVWTHLRDLSLTEQGYQERCHAPRLSRDGKVIVESCSEDASASRPRRDYLRVHSGGNWSVRTDIDLGFPTSTTTSYRHFGVGIDRTGETIAIQDSAFDQNTAKGSAAVRVYRRTNGVYALVTTLRPGAWRTSAWNFSYGDALAVSGDGQTIAIGDSADNGTGWGPRAAPLVSGASQLGAAYVYRLSGTWKLANMVKPNVDPQPGWDRLFGENVLLSGTGKTLVIPVPGESSSASGIGGNWADSSLGFAGAIFMY